mgnify:CR=1 FL=1
MSNLTAEQITNLDLYKNNVLPDDRLSADLLRAYQRDLLAIVIHQLTGK